MPHWDQGSQSFPPKPPNKLRAALFVWYECYSVILLTLIRIHHHYTKTVKKKTYELIVWFYLILILSYWMHRCAADAREISGSLNTWTCLRVQILQGDVGFDRQWQQLRPEANQSEDTGRGESGGGVITPGTECVFFFCLDDLDHERELLVEERTVSLEVSRLFPSHFSRVFCWLWRSLESRRTRRVLLVKRVAVCDLPLPITRVTGGHPNHNNFKIPRNESCSHVTGTAIWWLWKSCRVQTRAISFSHWLQDLKWHQETSRLWILDSGSCRTSHCF